MQTSKFTKIILVIALAAGLTAPSFAYLAQQCVDNRPEIKKFYQETLKSNNQRYTAAIRTAQEERKTTLNTIQTDYRTAIAAAKALTDASARKQAIKSARQARSAAIKAANNQYKSVRVAANEERKVANEAAKQARDSAIRTMAPCDNPCPLSQVNQDRLAEYDAIPAPERTFTGVLRQADTSGIRVALYMPYTLNGMQVNVLDDLSNYVGKRVRITGKSYRITSRVVELRPISIVCDDIFRTL